MKRQGGRLRSLTINRAGSRLLEFGAARTCANLRLLALRPDITTHRNIHRLLDVFEACRKGVRQLAVLVRAECMTLELINYATKRCTALGVYQVFPIFIIATIMSLLLAKQKNVHTLNIVNEECDWTDIELTLIASNRKNIQNLNVPYEMTGRLCYCAVRQAL